MADIRLSDQQQQQLGSLIAALGHDEGLRARFQDDVRSVFNEYGLGELLPVDMQIEARPIGAEVSGFALAQAGHSDFGHWDMAHLDTHLDTVIPVIGNYQIVPRFGSIA
jgi:hypothetical protein